jgi:hypothetical protein
MRMLWRMMLKRLCKCWILRRMMGIFGEKTLEKEDIVENDIQEVVQEEEDFEMDGYFENKNDVVEKDDIPQC